MLSKGRKRISLVLGTRPEAIKLCPLIEALRSHDRFEPHICVTGQHREMLDSVLATFEIIPDVDLALMCPNQSLGSLTARATEAIDGYLSDYEPDMVVVQGDTTTAFCAALCSFYHKIPVGHVEAGLRTGNRHSPFPEEVNRVLTSRLADLHFAPTQTAKDNLLQEGVCESRIVVTGNTVVDALRMTLDKLQASPVEIPDLPSDLMNGNSGVPVVLITGHRRESFGVGFENICHAVAELARRFPATQFIYPMHLNPHVRGPVQRILADHPNIHLIEPLDYLPFVALMSRATLLLTDSGGVQEEAPSLGKPVLVMRDTTERPEAVNMGTAKLVGTDREAIVENVAMLLANEGRSTERSSTPCPANPFGDGAACGRIVAAIERFWDRDEQRA